MTATSGVMRTLIVAFEDAFFHTMAITLDLLALAVQVQLLPSPSPSVYPSLGQCWSRWWQGSNLEGLQTLLNAATASRRRTRVFYTRGVCYHLISQIYS